MGAASTTYSIGVISSIEHVYYSTVSSRRNTKLSTVYSQITRVDSRWKRPGTVRHYGGQSMLMRTGFCIFYPIARLALGSVLKKVQSVHTLRHS